MRILNAPTSPPGTNIPVKVDSWYDRRTRSWITLLLDCHGNQVGDSHYNGTKAGRDFSIRIMSEKLKEDYHG